jgi:acetyltransferase-like isoleucine patch superfamily enzyme
MERTPVAIFAFRRPDHLRRLLISLSACHRKEACAFLIFCDGPRGPEDEAAVQAARLVAREWAAEEAAEVIESPTNRGLAASTVDEVTALCTKHGRTIVLEDDLEVSPDFLHFMLEALARYASCEEVLQISGYMFPVTPLGDNDAFFLPFGTTWGWATWARAWARFSWQPAGALERLAQPEERRRFNLDDGYDYAELLTARLRGANQSWGVLWYWAMFAARGVALHPRSTLVVNHGHDGSGTHCGSEPPLAAAPLWHLPAMVRWPETTAIHTGAFLRVKEFLRRNRPAKIRHSLLARLSQLLNRACHSFTPVAAARRRVRRQATLADTARVYPETHIENLFRRPERIVIGANSHVRGELLLYWEGGEIRIGEWSYVGAGTRIWSRHAVTIGNYVLISHLVDIHDTDGHPMDRMRRRQDIQAILGGAAPRPAHENGAPVVIEDDVWIGFKASILKGVRIGRGAIVAAGAVVIKDVAPGTVVAGNPARVIRAEPS